MRIFWEVTDSLSPTFGGRTDAAQMPTALLLHLQKTFTREKMHKQFPDAKKVVLFGEGYGPKIQACGGRYRKDISFILFDVCIDGCWLQKNSVAEVANGLDIEHTTFNHAPMTTQEVVDFVKSKPKSYMSDDPTLVMEGVIARSYPLMLFRHSKTPIMFKLKCKEFPDAPG